MKNKTILFLTLFSFVTVLGISQVTFINQTAVYNPELDLRSGSAGGFADLNGDGLDDLIIIDKANTLFLGYNTGSDNPMNWIEGPKVSSSREFLCLVTDLENDGENEIITSGAFSNTKVYKLKNDGNYTFDQQIKESILAQGGNTVDIDNDGFLDYFLCSDESDNLICINDQQGILRKRLDYIDWSTIPISDNSGNYASEWADVNNDGRIDLVIAKCRLGVNDKEDPRRINRLMIQQPDGTFVDEAAERGFDIGYQSWTSSLADFDNDGDFDCLITNHDHPHQWLVNDGNGYFTEKEINPSEPFNFSFQGIVRDFDNDGFQDVFIPGDALNILLLNQEGESFEVINDPIGNPATSATVGDINNDGLIDINAFYPTNINFPGQTRDRIFVNNTVNNNQFIDLKLIGSESNILAVGAIAKVYSNVGIQTQVVKSGESYGITNSFVLHFGLGQDPVVDSIVIDWPSGNRTILNPKIFNKKFEIQEGQCFVDNIQIYNETLYLCDDSLTLQAPTGYTDYSWSNDADEQEIKIFVPGIYQVTMLNDTGCVVRSTPIVVMQGSIDPPLISNFEPLIGCYLDTISLFAFKEGKSYLWNDLDSSKTYEAINEELVSLAMLDFCDNWVFDSANIVRIDPNQFIAVGDTVMKGENAILSAEGANISWYAALQANDPIFEGNELSIFNVQSSQDYFVSNKVSGYKSFYSTGIDIWNTDDYLHDEVDAFDLLFTVFEPFVIQKVMLKTDVEGFRKFIIRDEQLNIIDEVEVFIEQGIGEYDLDLEVPVGQLIYFGTDADYNQEQFGTRSPQLASNLQNINYPYSITSLGDIISSTGSKSLYPYFYNLKVASNPFECESERRLVQLFLDIDLKTTNTVFSKVRLYPNPVNDILTIDAEESIDKIDIYNSIGEKIYCHNEISNYLEVNVSLYPTGFYKVVVYVGDEPLSYNLIKN